MWRGMFMAVRGFRIKAARDDRFVQ